MHAEDDKRDDDRRDECYYLPDFRWGGEITAGQPAASWPVSVGVIIADLTHLLGHVPEELASESAVRTFAMSCRLPVADEDIESALFCHGDVEYHPRWASRAWVRKEYRKFYTWYTNTPWGSRDERLNRALAAA
jgi:hypothetical protein